MTVTTHVRIVNGGTPKLISISEALSEINHAMMDGKRDVAGMSHARSSASIRYRDGRHVELRPATAKGVEAATTEPTWGTLAGLKDGDVLTVWCYEPHQDRQVWLITAGPGADRLAKARPVRITITTATGHRSGTTQDGHHVSLGTGATRVWASR